MGTLISLFLPLLHLPVILRSAPVEKCHRDLKVLKISSPMSFQAEIPANVGLLLFFPTFSPWEAVPWCSEVPAALPAVLLELCRALRRNFSWRNSQQGWECRAAPFPGCSWHKEFVPGAAGRGRRSWRGAGEASLGSDSGLCVLRMRPRGIRGSARLGLSCFSLFWCLEGLCRERRQREKGEWCHRDGSVTALLGAEARPGWDPGRDLSGTPIISLPKAPGTPVFSRG